MQLYVRLALAIALVTVAIPAVPTASATCVDSICFCTTPVGPCVLCLVEGEGTCCTNLTTCYLQPIEQLVPQVKNVQTTTNPDGTETVSFDVCFGSGSCTHVAETIPTACLAYNPDALTNLCVTTGSQPEGVSVPEPTVGSRTITVPVPTVGTTPDHVCIVGPECVDVPVPGVGTNPTPETVPDVGVSWQTVVVNVPTVGGYVEATALCGLNVPCSVTL